MDLEKAGCKSCEGLWISSVTDKAIKEGFAHLRPGKDYENLYAAAVSRAEADWLVGINATRALTCGIIRAAFLRTCTDTYFSHDSQKRRGNQEVSAGRILRNYFKSRKYALEMAG